MIPISISLSHYKRREIQDEIIANSKDREVAAKFNEYFSKRPDVLRHPNDVLELAKQGATSFHASEELWKNALQLDTSLRRDELDNLRIGWDLIIDVDCTIWDYSKVITAFIIQALRENGIASISCKFSGNKGFHIGVPFESFPQSVNKKETRLLFPDGVRIIASYLISEEIDKENRLSNYILKSGLDAMFEKTGKSREEIIKNVCSKCSKVIENKKNKFEYICTKCGKNTVSGEDFVLKCDKCRIIMIKKSITKNTGLCNKHGSEYITAKLDLQKIISIDSIMISSRHLYRMPYSLHEKSGLVSLPLNPDEVLSFEKESAIPKNIKVSKYRFLDKEKVNHNEALLLFDKSFAWYINKESANIDMKYHAGNHKVDFDIKAPLTEDFFPPCIKLILNGVDDGRKRALFILINYFASIGWSYDMIEKELNAWNRKNKEPLREVYVLGQLKYHKHTRKSILPPNCNNEGYMLGIGVCKPDNFCPRIKNPAQYSLKKARFVKKI